MLQLLVVKKSSGYGSFATQKGFARIMISKSFFILQNSNKLTLGIENIGGKPESESERE